MARSKQHFLLVLLFSLFVQSQVLAPSSPCLAPCNSCDPLALARCLSPPSCDWGFSPSGSLCLPSPSIQIVSTELGQRSGNAVMKAQVGWSESARQTVCEYVSSGGRRFIDALGMFSGVQMLQRTFEVDPLAAVFELSFSLLQESWVPFNDFLIVDVSSKNENIETLEISYDTLIPVESQAAVMTCGGKRVMSKKFSIRFAGNGKVDNRLTVIFTSFLYSSTWGVTNIRLAQGCLGYARLDPTSSDQCGICDSDAHHVAQLSASRCVKCPPLCTTCNSTACLTCVSGAAVDGSGVCSFGSSFKMQTVAVGAGPMGCDGEMQLGSSSTDVSLGAIRNDEGLLYDEIQLGFNLFYQPSEWNATVKDYLSVRLNKIEVMRIDYRNLTNIGTTRCTAFKTNRTAKIELFSKKIVHNDNSALLQFVLMGSTKELQFGVGNVRVKSILKEKPAPTANTTTTPPSANTTTTNTIAPSNTSITNTTVPNAIKPVNTSIPANTTQNATKTANTTVPNANNIAANTTTANTTVPNASNPVKDDLQTPTSFPPLPTKPINQSQTPNNTQPSTPIVTPFIPPTPAVPISQPVTPQDTLPPVVPADNSIKPQDQVIPPPIDPRPDPVPTRPLPNPLAKDEVGQYLSDVIAASSKGNDQEKIAFIPAFTQNRSGLHILLTAQQPDDTHIYNAYIDKLTPDLYDIESYYFQDGKLHIFLCINSTFLDATVAIYRYSTARRLTSQEQGNQLLSQTTQKQSKTAQSQRLLTTAPPSLVGSFTIARFDALPASHIDSIRNFSWVFTVAGWVGVIGILLAVVVGYGVVVEEYVVGLQVLFLHVYIGSDFLPLSFREVVGGLSLVENLNWGVEPKWAGQGFNGPIRFSMFHSDINCLREFIPIIVANVIYLLWFGCSKLVQRRVNRGLIDQQKRLPHRLIDNIAGRVVNFCDQIWRYQFLATVWICLVQFYGLAYSSHGGAFQGLFSAVALVCCLGWPVFVTLHCRREYYECEYSQFLYYFEDIYYRRIPQYELPSNHHRMGYPIMRAGKLLLIALAVCFLASNYLFTLLFLALLHLSELFYIKTHEIYSDRRCLLFKVLENVVLVCMQVALAVLLGCGRLADGSAFVTMGYVLSAAGLLLVLNGAVRVGYLARKKWQEAVECDLQELYPDKQPKTERVV